MGSLEVDIDRIGALLQQGLDHYGRNEIEQAIACWCRVIELDPNQPEARDYLEAAGVALASVPPLEAFEVAVARGSAAIAPDVEQCLRERRFEDALKLLYAARAQSPKDPAISRSIRLLRERIAVDYAARLVNLDRVPSRANGISPGALSSEERQVLTLVDGISSFGDIVAASTMGRLNTLRVLCVLSDAGFVNATSPSVSPPRTRPEFSGRRGVVEPSPPTVPSSRVVVEAPPAPSSRPSAPPSAPPPSWPSPQSVSQPSSRPQVIRHDDFDHWFARATEAYLVRDYGSAIELFTKCAQLRPDDRRVLHNLKALQRRRESP